MVDKSVIKNFSTNVEFVDLNKPSDLERVLAECTKLNNLTNYPNVVNSKIDSTRSKILDLENEISEELSKQTTFILKIKRKQDLSLKYKELKQLRDDLNKFKEELIVAYKVKDLASHKLRMYEKLIARFNGQEV